MEYGIWEILGGLVILATLVTGPSIWIFRSGVQDIKDSTEGQIENLRKNQHSTITTLGENLHRTTNGLKEDFIELRKHVDGVMANVHNNMDSKNRELTNTFNQQIESLRRPIRDVENSMLNMNEHYHKLDKDILQLKADLARGFVGRQEYERNLADIRQEMVELKKGQ